MNINELVVPKSEGKGKKGDKTWIVISVKKGTPESDMIIKLKSKYNLNKTILNMLKTIN